MAEVRSKVAGWPWAEPAAKTKIIIARPIVFIQDTSLTRYNDADVFVKSDARHTCLGVGSAAVKAG